MNELMYLDDGDDVPPITTTNLSPSCVCTWERVDRHWKLIRLVPTCVRHRHLVDPRFTNAHGWTTPDEQPLSQLLGEVLDLAEAEAARRITDEHIEARLAEIVEERNDG